MNERVRKGEKRKLFKHLEEKKISTVLFKMPSKHQKPELKVAKANTACWLPQPQSLIPSYLAAFATEAGKTKCLLSQLHLQLAETM